MTNSSADYKHPQITQIKNTQDKAQGKGALPPLNEQLSSSKADPLLSPYWSVLESVNLRNLRMFAMISSSTRTKWNAMPVRGF